MRKIAPGFNSNHNGIGKVFKRLEEPGVFGAKLRAAATSGGLSATADDVWKLRDGRTAADAEPGAKIVQKAMPSFLQVLASPRNASRQSRPMSLWVPPLTWRLVTWQRMSFSEPLVCFAAQLCSGTSGCSSTINSSTLLACSRLSRRSRVGKPVGRQKM